MDTFRHNQNSFGGQPEYGEKRSFHKKIKTDIVVKNKVDYSENFIQGLRELGYEKFELRDSLLLINGKDTAYFPETSRIGKQMILTGRKGNLAIALTVRRINYTTVDYNIEMVEFGKSSHNQSG